MEALDRLATADLDDDGWAHVMSFVHECSSHIESGQELADGRDDAFGRAVQQLSVAGFHAQVRRRLGSGGRAAPAVVPARRSPVLPLVGLVCGAGIGALGWAIGGGLVAVGTGLFALFILGVALAGTHAANERRHGVVHGAPDEVDRDRQATLAEQATMQALRDQLHRPPG